MKDTLIQLATDKGFESEEYDAHDESYPLNGLHYYLWNCELQKWLRDKHSMDVEINNEMFNTSLYYSCTIFNTDFKYTNGNYEAALEKGLFEALNLIKG